VPFLAAAALAVIRPEDVDGDALVFIPQRGARLAVNHDWQRIRAYAELPATLSLHGLRHSAGTVAVMAGMSGPEVQKLLRHRNLHTTSRYIHLADRLRLQDRVFDHLLPPKKAGTA
jgi:site-specific recombinase XerD